MSNQISSWLLFSLLLNLSTAFIAVPLKNNGFIVSSPSKSLYATNDNNSDEWRKHRLAEFVNLESLPESNTRRARIERENQNKLKFANYGNDLWDLRSNINDLSNELIFAIQKGNKHVENTLRESLIEAEQRDPEIVYKTEVELMKDAAAENRFEDESEHKKNALNARSCLPHLNLEGLWIGKYGDYGYELINVTYVGDTMIAYKVTGDQNVPKGEITFQVDLNTVISQKTDRRDAEPLNPIVLTDKASKKWGTKQLQRYPGLGRVAEKTFQNSQWMEGQLIIIGEEYFSFAWIPIEHQIFFGRPSPEMVLKMLKDGGTSTLKVRSWDERPKIDDDITVWKDFATYCYEKTEEIIDEELSGNERCCIWTGIDTEERYFE